MNNYLEKLSENIANCRKKLGITQEAMAKELGVSYQAVSKWEKGRSCPDISQLPLLAQMFGITIDSLFGIADISGSLLWEDDNVIRGVVYKGRKMLIANEDIVNFKFSIEGSPCGVVSYCNIECGNISGGATAGTVINCGGHISGGAKAGTVINCGGGISGGAVAGTEIHCGGDISGDVNSGGDLHCKTADSRKDKMYPSEDLINE